MHTFTLCLLVAAMMLVAPRADGAPPVSLRIARQPTPTLLAEYRGVKIFDGGYGSAVVGDPKAPGYLYLLTDRGPNFEGTVENQKIFPVPGFSPRIARVRVMNGILERVSLIELTAKSGRKITGLPNPPGPGGTGESAADPNGAALPFDSDGLDPEGLVALPEGGFWIADEYGPYLVHVDASGKELERISPFGRGGRSLPRVLARRRPNRGMEGLAMVPRRPILVGMMQSPLDNPSSSVRRTSRVTRIATFDVITGATRQFVYLQEAAGLLNSEIIALSDSIFLVLERDGAFAGDLDAPAEYKRIYRVDLAGATDVSDAADAAAGVMVGGKTLEQLSDAELRTAGIVPVNKSLVVDLLTLPLRYPHDKPEGIAVLDDQTIIVSNDDDFGIKDDGGGRLAQKFVPGGPILIDRGTVFFLTIGSLSRR